MDSEIHFFVFTDISQIPNRDNPKTLTVTIDGNNTPVMNKLYIQLNQELRFGGAFGKNLDALFDSMSDLSWFDETNFIIIITHTENFLIDENEVEIIDLLDTLNDVASSINDEPLISNQNRQMKFYFEESDRITGLLDDSYQDWEYLE